LRLGVRQLTEQSVKAWGLAEAWPRPDRAYLHHKK